MKTEVLTLNKERNVTLTTYIQDCGEGFGCVAKLPAVLILPGGAYQMCSDREADPVAFAFAKAGYHAFVLRYSVMDDCTWPNPLNDYEQAMTLIRSHADTWHIYEDKIAVIGFSAGGHLATAAATLAQNRPNAAILGYAVTSQHVQACNPNAPETISAVDRKHHLALSLQHVQTAWFQSTIPLILCALYQTMALPLKVIFMLMDHMVFPHAKAVFRTHVHKPSARVYHTGWKTVLAG